MNKPVKRSAMVAEHFPDEIDSYSPLGVYKSNAGFYIGTVYTSKDGFVEPGTRDSQYFRTQEEAQSALDNDSYEVRMEP